MAVVGRFHTSPQTWSLQSHSVFPVRFLRYHQKHFPGLGGVVLYPRTAGDKVAILKTKLPSETPPQRRAETPGEFQLFIGRKCSTWDGIILPHFQSNQLAWLHATSCCFQVCELVS